MCPEYHDDSYVDKRSSTIATLPNNVCREAAIKACITFTLLYIDLVVSLVP